MPRSRGRGLAVEFAAGGVPLLDAHHVHGLETIGHDAEVAAGTHQGTGECVSPGGRDAQLIGELARKRDPEEPSRHAPEKGERHRPP